MSRTHVHPGFDTDPSVAALLPDPTVDQQAPSATSTITLVEHLGIDGLVTGTFQGYEPQRLSGTLVLAVGGSAWTVPSVEPSAAPLNHVIADSPVVDPTVLADLAFSTPASGADNGSSTDIGVAATTVGFSGLVGPLVPALAGTTLGNELDPLLKLSGYLLPGLGKNGGLPGGGVLTAKPFFTASVGIGLAQSTTILGITTGTHADGTLLFNKEDGQAVVNAAQDTANLLGDGATLLNDVQSGNLLAAVGEGVTTLGAGVALGGAVGTLLTDAGNQHGGTLAAVKNPALSLNLATQDSQSYQLGLGTPLGVSEQLDVQITADKFGAYALGKLAASVLPQVIADYGSGGVPDASSIFAQLAQGVSALSQSLLAGNTQAAPGIPSLGSAADISITATLVTGETQTILGGTANAMQTFTLGLDSNAQGLFDLGTASAPALADLLVGILETPQGQEALGVGGAILQSIDSQINTGSGSAASFDPPDFYHNMAHIGFAS